MKLKWEDVAKKYGAVINKNAMQLSRRYHIDFEELHAEGIWGAWSQLHNWDPKRGCLCTWIYRTSYHTILNYCLAQKKREQREIPLQTSSPACEDDIFDIQARTSWINSLLLELGEEARMLVSVALEAPEELAEVLRARAPMSSANALREYMIDALDWDEEKVDRTWREVQACLGE